MQNYITVSLQLSTWHDGGHCKPAQGSIDILQSPTNTNTPPIEHVFALFMIIALLTSNLIFFVSRSDPSCTTVVSFKNNPIYATTNKTHTLAVTWGIYVIRTVVYDPRQWRGLLQLVATDFGVSDLNGCSISSSSIVRCNLRSEIVHQTITQSPPIGELPHMLGNQLPVGLEIQRRTFAVIRGKPGEGPVNTLALLQQVSWQWKLKVKTIRSFKAVPDLSINYNRVGFNLR